MIMLLMMPIVGMQKKNEENIATYVTALENRIIGQSITAYDDKYKKLVEKSNEIEDDEIVAYQLDGHLVYGWVTDKPKGSQIALISNCEGSYRHGRTYSLREEKIYTLPGKPKFIPTVGDVEKGNDR